MPETPLVILFSGHGAVCLMAHCAMLTISVALSQLVHQHRVILLIQVLTRPCIAAVLFNIVMSL